MSIIIKPISAQLLKNLDLNSKQDPYCSVYVGQQNKQTQVHKEGGLHPVWDDSLKFTLGQQTDIKIKVYDKDLINDDFIGQGSIKIQDIRQSKLQQEIVNLVDKKQQHAGSVMIKVWFSDGVSNSNNQQKIETKQNTQKQKEQNIQQTEQANQKPSKKESKQENQNQWLL